MDTMVMRRKYHFSSFQKRYEILSLSQKKIKITFVIYMDFDLGGELQKSRTYVRGYTFSMELRISSSSFGTWHCQTSTFFGCI